MTLIALAFVVASLATIAFASIALAYTSETLYQGRRTGALAPDLDSRLAIFARDRGLVLRGDVWASVTAHARGWISAPPVARIQGADAWARARRIEGRVVGSRALTVRACPLALADTVAPPVGLADRLRAIGAVGAALRAERIIAPLGGK